MEVYRSIVSFLYRAECDELRRATSMIRGKEVALARADQLQEKQQRLQEAQKGNRLV